MILTFAFNGTDGISPNTGLVYSPGQVFGFLLLICITVGVVVGGVVGADPRPRARARAPAT